MPQLVIKDVNLSFGGLKVLSNIDLSVEAGSFYAVIGPNGAGKTCLLNCICGLYPPSSGEILFGENFLQKLQPHTIARLGISRVFQNIELFKHITVIDNLMLGRHRLMRTGVLACSWFFGRSCREEIAHRERVEEIIEFLELENYRKQPVGSLPYGLQKRVELGRALAGEPKLLLLDEPVAGMNLEEKEDMARFIMVIRAELKPTILLVEHDMGFVMDLAERIAVLDFGRKIAEGTPVELQKNQQVIEAYLGMEDAGETIRM